MCELQSFDGVPSKEGKEKGQFEVYLRRYNR